MPVSESGRLRQPSHSMALEMTGVTWLTESVYFNATVSAGNLVCYYGEDAAGRSRVVLATFGDTSACMGSTTWAKTAHRKLAGVAISGQAIASTGPIAIAGRVSITKEATAIGIGKSIIMGATNDGYCTEGSVSDVLTNNCIGFAADNATAGDSKVDAHIFPWRV